MCIAPIRYLNRPVKVLPLTGVVALIEVTGCDVVIIAPARRQLDMFAGRWEGCVPLHLLSDILYRHARVVGKREQIFVRFVSYLKEVLSAGPVSPCIVDPGQVVRAGTPVSHLEVVRFNTLVLIEVLTIEGVPVVIVLAISYLPAVVPARTYPLPVPAGLRRTRTLHPIPRTPRTRHLGGHVVRLDIDHVGYLRILRIVLLFFLGNGALLAHDYFNYYFN